VEAPESADFNLIAGSQGTHDAVKYTAHNDVRLLPGHLNGAGNLFGKIGPGHLTRPRFITQSVSRYSLIASAASFLANGFLANGALTGSGDNWISGRNRGGTFASVSCAVLFQNRALSEQPYRRRVSKSSGFETAPQRGVPKGVGLEQFGSGKRHECSSAGPAAPAVAGPVSFF
jgi:hypothetical protein